MCAIAAPEVFGSDEMGNAIVLIDGDIPAELQAKTRRAEILPVHIKNTFV